MHRRNVGLALLLGAGLGLWLFAAASALAGAIEDAEAGLVAAEQQGDFDRALQLLAKAIDSGQLDNENLASAYNNRGVAWVGKKQYDKAILDFSKSIELDPRGREAFKNRGAAWEARGDVEKAVADYTQAIKRDPGYAEAWERRNTLLRKVAEERRLDMRQFPGLNATGAAAKTPKVQQDKDTPQSRHKSMTEALAEARQKIGVSTPREDVRQACLDALDQAEAALRTSPDDQPARLRKAWVLATCPDDQGRDPEKAKQLATEVVTRTKWKDAEALDVLAATYAALGRFEDAASVQRQALALARDELQAKPLAQRLRVYEQGRPWFEAP